MRREIRELQVSLLLRLASGAERSMAVARNYLTSVYDYLWMSALDMTKQLQSADCTFSVVLPRRRIAGRTPEGQVALEGMDLPLARIDAAAGARLLHYDLAQRR